MSGVLIFKLLILSFSVLNALVLILNGNKGQIRNYYLGWSLLFYGVYFLVFILWYEMEFILVQPHLMRTCSPLGFLAAPFFYFFIRNNATNVKGLKRKDVLHFIPAAVHFLELTPFYLIPGPEKLAIAREVVDSPYQLDLLARGLIHPNLVNAVRVILIASYFTLSCWILYRKGSFPDGFLTKSWSKNWLLVAIVLIGGINLGYFAFRVAFFAGVAAGADLGFAQTHASYLILFCMLILSLYIQLNPERVFKWGEEPVNRREPGQLSGEENTLDLDPDQLGKPAMENDSGFFLNEEVREAIEALFYEEQIYRKQGLLVGDLAKRLQVPVRDLPVYFRHYYRSDFKTLVNEYRVKLAKTKIEEGYLDDYTVESLGEYCGFRSRTTFFNAFKKKYGMSPNEYWKVFQEN